MKETVPILRAAEQVADILKQHRVDAVVIGAVALAAYHYVRQTGTSTLMSMPILPPCGMC